VSFDLQYLVDNTILGLVNVGDGDKLAKLVSVPKSLENFGEQIKCDNSNDIITKYEYVSPNMYKTNQQSEHNLAEIIKSSNSARKVTINKIGDCLFNNVGANPAYIVAAADQLFIINNIVCIISSNISIGRVNAKLLYHHQGMSTGNIYYRPII
jgi:hypothetical protein